MAVALNVIKRTMMKWVGEIIDGLAELNAYCCHDDDFHLNFASSSLSGQLIHPWNNQSFKEKIETIMVTQ